MKKILAISDIDVSYSEQLAKGLNRIENSIFHAVVFSDISSLKDYEKNNHIEVLLCDEGFLAGEESSADIIIELTSISQAAENSARNTIFKFQSTESIMKEIMQLYGRKYQRNEGEIINTKSRIFSVCSPVGGSYSSTFALALAAYYSKKGRTLFLSLDPFFSLPGERKDPYEKNFTDVIYYLEQNEDDVFGHISSMVSHLGELDYLAGASHWFDLYDLSPRHTHSMLESLSSSGAYDVIVFDVGIIGVASMELLLVSEKIYTPIGSGANSKDKIAEWKRQIEFCGKMDLLEKQHEVRLPYDEILDGNYDYENILEGRTGRIIQEMEG